MPPNKKFYNKKNQDNLIYKLLNKYLLNPSEEILKRLCQNPTESKTLRNKTLQYVLAFPNIANKIDKYANNLYSSSLSNATDEEWFRFISYIFRSRITNSNSFYFTKYYVQDYVTFSNKIKNYYNQLDELFSLSSQEIQSLYILYKEGLIPDSLLDSVTELGEAEKSSISTNNKPSIFNNIQNITENNNRSQDTLSPNIQQLINSCLSYIQTNPGCKTCEGFRNKTITIDTNIKELNSSTNIDVLFLGLHPLYEDTEKNLPYSGKSTSIIRDVINLLVNKYGNNFEWAICNILQCTFDINKEIKFDNSIIKCSPIFNIFLNNLKPKIIVTLGDKVMKYFKIKGTLSKNNANVFEIDNKTIIPTVDIINISSRGKNNFEKALNTLISLLDSADIKNKLSTNSQNNINCNYDIPQENIITKLNNNYTLIDIKELNNQLIYIMKDENGNKKYYIEEAKVPVYIKFGNYKQCNMITNDVDQVVYLNLFELAQLNKKLYQDMNSLIKNP